MVIELCICIVETSSARVVSGIKKNLVHIGLLWLRKRDDDNLGDIASKDV